jgi:hypothetical protein
MVALGAHYLPFVFLCGMRMFGALGLILAAGLVLVNRERGAGLRAP